MTTLNCMANVPYAPVDTVQFCKEIAEALEGVSIAGRGVQMPEDWNRLVGQPGPLAVFPAGSQ